MYTTIGVLSGKGGVGKTTIVSNLGIALAKNFNRESIIVDGNIRNSHLGLHFGLYEDLPYTIIDVLRHNIPVSKAIYIHTDSGLRLLPSSLSGGEVSLHRLNHLIMALKKVYDLILVDFPPGLGKETISAIRSVDTALIVTTPELPSVSDALKTINILRRLKKDVKGIIINRYRNVKYELSTEEIESTCNLNVLAELPDERRMAECIAKGIPIVLDKPRTDFSRRINRLATLILGKEYMPDGFLEKLKRIFSGKKIQSAEYEKPFVPLNSTLKDKAKMARI